MELESCLQHERIASWLLSTCDVHQPLTPPPDEEIEPRPTPLKRKRAMSLASAYSSQRSGSAKRPRADGSDDVQSGQSVSESGQEGPFTLNRVTTFSPPASRVSSTSKRSSSPTRETQTLLKHAFPPICKEDLNGLLDPPPSQVLELGELLAKGTEHGFIPYGLKKIIADDREIGNQMMKSDDFDENDDRSPEELERIWKKAKRIFLNAHECKEYSRDENAWCDEVVRPLILLAVRMSGERGLWLQSVQSQSNNPRYVSTIAAPTPLDPNHRRTIDRKTDYTFSYSHRDPAMAAMYERFNSKKREVGHTRDAFTKRTALFSAIEVKCASGDLVEAETQMSVWIAASIRKKQELGRAVKALPQPAAMVEPALTVVGHDHSMYYAYPRDHGTTKTKGVHVLGPDRDRLGGLSTSSVRGVFRLAKLYGNILQYGTDQGENGYWGRFLGPVLQKLGDA